MTDPRPEVSVAEARAIVLGVVRPLPDEEVPLADAAERVLAETLRAPRDLPPWDHSQMDGYAVRAADLCPGARLAVIETVLAGGRAAREVGAGQAIRVMTGAPMPSGADTVVPVESAEAEGREAVRLTGALPAAGGLVRRAGEDLRAGEVALPEGAVLSPASLGVAASLGRAAVRVHRRPRVAILATGDELAPVGEEAGPGRIHASSSVALLAAARRAGAETRDAGIARDTPGEIREKLEGALAGADVVLTTGGVSAGEADHVRGVIEALGGRFLVHRVAQKPGHPLAVAMVGGVLVFGLPGNPVSTLVCFDQYVRPALLRMAGRTRIFPPVVDARLEELVKGAKRFQFLRGVLRRDGSGWAIRTAGNQSSGALTSLARANALLLVPAGVEALEPGATVRVQVLDPALDHTEAADAG